MGSTRQGNSRYARQAGFRAALTIAALEVSGYVAMFLYIGSRLGSSASGGSANARVQLLGHALLWGSRSGSSSRVTAAAWLLPALALVPAIVWVGVVVLRRERRGSMPIHVT